VNIARSSARSATIRSYTSLNNGESIKYEPVTFQRKALLHRLKFSHLTESQFDFVMYVCARRGLDPWLGHVTALVVQDAQTGLPTLDIVTNHSAERLLSERTGLFDGEGAPQCCGPDGGWVDLWDFQGGSNFPLAARMTVRPRDITEPFVAVATWGEFAEIVDGKVSDDWKKHGVRLLADRAAILGHASAFPEESSSVWTQEEDTSARSTPEPTVAVAGSLNCAASSVPKLDCRANIIVVVDLLAKIREKLYEALDEADHRYKTHFDSENGRPAGTQRLPPAGCV